MQNTFGGQLRNDAISTVGLHHTAGRELLDTTREDSVLQTSGGVFVQNEMAWSPTLRTLVGLRADVFRFGVESDNPLNTGSESAGIFSPKGGVVIGPFGGTEFYANAGLGFHSNDARGATISIDPATGEPADRVTPLARAKAIEGGLRTVAVKGLQTSLTVWSLNLESELIFVGDAGTTAAVGRAIATASSSPTTTARARGSPSTSTGPGPAGTSGMTTRRVTPFPGPSKRSFRLAWP